MNDPLNDSNFNRLAVSLMESKSCSYYEAVNRLKSFSLKIVCGLPIRHSVSMQVALISAVNAGTRAFLGGVSIYLPEPEIPSLIKNHPKSTLDKMLAGNAVTLIKQPTEGVVSFTLYIGLHPDCRDNCLELVCNDWLAGVTTKGSPIVLSGTDGFGLGGVAAAGLGVGIGFLITSEIEKNPIKETCGVSLWRPDLHWLDPLAAGGEIDHLPAKIWALGLGHLGQAYLWALTFLPYPTNSKPLITLQDNQTLQQANMGAGLLSSTNHVGRMKTRICAEWLEIRGFSTRIVERVFDGDTRIQAGDPRVAVCGFDNAAGRMLLEDAGFDLVIEAGIGGKLDSFDDISLHTFPNAEKTPKEIWRMQIAEKPNLSVLKLKPKNADCGVLFDELAKKAISTAFVGMLTGALVAAELARAANCQCRFEEINFQFRAFQHRTVFHGQDYRTEMAKNGTISRA